MNESQMNSSGQINLKDEMNQEFRRFLDKLAFQFHSDIKSVEDKYASIIKQREQSQQGQSVEDLKTKMLEEESILAETYENNIKQLKKIQSEAEIKLKEQEIQFQLNYLDYFKQQIEEQNLIGTVQLHKELIQRQTSTIEQLQFYLKALFQRIKHQNYANQQQQILKYLQRQIAVFKIQKEQVKEIIQKVRKQRKEMYDAARKFCQIKTQQIKQLEDIKRQTSYKLEKQKQSGVRLSEKQIQLYKQISMLTLTPNSKILASKSKVSNQNQNKKLLGQASEKEFKSKNFGSIIQPVQASQKENPSLILSQQASSSNQIKVPVCEVPSYTQKEAYIRKFIILLLLIVSIVYYFS